MALLLVGASPNRLVDHELHWHDCYEIIVNTEGEGTAEIGEQAYPFAPGSVHVIPPEMPHRKTAPGGFRDIYLRTDTLKRTDVPHQNLQTVTQPLILSDDSCHTMTNLMIILLSRYLLQKEKDQVTETVYNAVLEMIGESVTQQPINPAVSRVIQNITASYSDPDFQVTDALTATGYNRDYLRRIFQQTTGMTPHGYLTDIRIRYAKRLLLQKLPVSEVALLSGYYDPDYFCRLFRIQTGMTPTAFQKKHTEFRL
ncbi:MAG: helix-turn-helix transcriptional regulator [Clostridia bacterium]|nr:helix-turn-helix transcriptional regulator [Clostridia bacterium]